MLYPLFFNPVYKNIIWGGRNFEKIFKRNLPEGNIAESWEICCHKNGMSVVSNGYLKGKNLKKLIDKYGKELLGTKNSYLTTFPLLIKFIDANDRLSVQVHPDDDYAMAAEGEMGKTEMWYIVDTKEDAKLIYGVKEGTKKEEFRNAIISGTLEEYLNYHPVKKGDVVFIPSGTIHAILDGIVIAEIQQNSDTTYRVYDWNRVDNSGNPRQLHVEKALDVINFDFKPKSTNIRMKSHEGYDAACASSCDYFTVDIIKVGQQYRDKTDGSTFYIFTSVEGQGKLLYKNEEYPLTSGCSFLIPACCGEFEICGDITLLKSYV